MQIFSFKNSKCLTFRILRDNMSIKVSNALKTMLFESEFAVHFNFKYSNEKYFERKFWVIVKCGLKLQSVFKMWSISRLLMMASVLVHS